MGGLDILEQHPGFARLGSGSVDFSIHADEAYEGHPWYDALHHEGLARGVGAELRVAVDDVEPAYRKALMAGASVVYPPHDQEGARECQVLAPDGYLVTLWSSPGTAA